MRKILKVTLTIVGTIIGAGFASGQEIFLFFGQYGKMRNCKYDFFMCSKWIYHLQNTGVCKKKSGSYL